MKKITVYIALALIIIIVGAVALRPKSDTHMGTTGIYCGADGKLSASKSIQSHRSYCIKVSSTAQDFLPNVPSAYSFTLVDDQGLVLKDLQTEHEKLLHLIVARKDLGEFQHVHPDFSTSTGVFTLSNLKFPSAGDYRIFADFTPTNAQIGTDGMPLPVIAYQDVTVRGAYAPQPLGTVDTIKNVDGYTVSLTTNPQKLVSGTDMLSFAIVQNGKQVTDLEDYLGALGHSVVLKENTLDYIHTHAQEAPSSKQNGIITFHVEFPSAGNYKVFLQFKRGGAVETVSFVVPVTTGGSNSTQEMNHSMHQ